MTRIGTGKAVRVTKESPHHVGVCGNVEFYGTGDSEGCVVLCIEKNEFGWATLIAVDEHHIALLRTDDDDRYW